MAWSLGQAEDYLLSLELFGMRFGLDRMHKLMAALGMPQHRYAQIHVVGSNGKSSTVRFIAALLERHGLRTGSYTSPHLRSFRERIEVGEKPLAGERFAAAVARAADAARSVERSLAADDRVTQFEALTAAAYHELAASGVEVAVIEAGLGGRHDATNVIPSRVQVLTGVGLEHTSWLGSTLTEIAEEKLAVVRDHTALAVGELDPEVMRVAERVARDHSTALLTAPREVPGLQLRAGGGFQRRNFALATVAAEAFVGSPLGRTAVESAAAETLVPGRLEVVADRPLTIHDGAHNPAGAKALVQALPEATGGRRPLVLVLSVLEDKDAPAMLELLLPEADHVVLTQCSNPRAIPSDALEGLTEKMHGGTRETVAEPRVALARAQDLAGPDGVVVAAGSISLVGDLAGGSRPRSPRRRLPYGHP